QNRTRKRWNVTRRPSNTREVVGPRARVAGRAPPRKTTRTYDMDQPALTGAAAGLHAPLVVVDHLRQVYRKGGAGDVLGLDDVNPALADSEIVALLGRSGSGKSTLLRIISGLMPPTRGSVTIAGHPVDGPAGDVAMVFQSFALFPWLTVLENVEIGLEAQGIAP